MENKNSLKWSLVRSANLNQYRAEADGFEAKVWCEPFSKDDWRYMVNRGNIIKALSKEKAMEAVELDRQKPQPERRKPGESLNCCSGVSDLSFKSAKERTRNRPANPPMLRQSSGAGALR